MSGDLREESRRNWVAHIATVGLLLLALGLAHGGGLRNGFITFDDPDVILRNPRLAHPSVVDAVEVFGEVRDHAYLPFYYLALMVDAGFGGRSATAFHLGSLLWHAANTILVFAFLLRLFRSTERAHFLAAVSALVFATHPMSVESVAWASGRKDQTSLALLLFGMHLFLSYLRRGGVLRAGAALLVSFLSCFAKGSTLIFPLFFLLVFVKERQGGKLSTGGVRIVLALAFLCAGTAAIVHYRIALSEGTTGAAATYSPLAGAGLFLEAVTRYVQHVLFPVELSIHYHLPVPQGATWRHVLGGGLFVALSLAWLPRMQRRFRLLAFCSAWSLAALLPFNNVFPKTSVAMADRYFAVALPVVGLGLSALLLRFRPILGWVLALAISAALAFLSSARTRDFRDGETVFREAMRVDAKDPLPPAQVAESLLERAKRGADRRRLQDEAFSLFAKSAELAEAEADTVGSVRARLRLADTLLRCGHFERAASEFQTVETAIALEPTRLKTLGVDPLIVRHNRAQALLGQGLVLDGQELIDGILKEAPEHRESRATLALLNVRQGFEILSAAKLEDVKDRARLLINRGVTGMRSLLQELSAQRGERTEDHQRLEIRLRTDLSRTLRHAPWLPNYLGDAVSEMSTLIDRYPDAPEGYLLRATFKEESGERDAAILDWILALERDPSDTTARLKVARQLRVMGENRRALDFLRAGIAVDSENAALKGEISDLLVQQARNHLNAGDIEKALEAASRAVELDAKSVSANTLEGLVQESRQEWSLAEVAYRRALTIDSEATEARQGLGRFHQARGLRVLSELRSRVDKSKPEEKATVERNLRDVVRAEFRLALEFGMAAEDVAIARRWLKEDQRGPESAAGQQFRDHAQAALAAERWIEAEELLKKSIDVDPTNPESQFLLADAYRRQQKNSEALTHAERAVSLDPESLPALQLVVELAYIKARYELCSDAATRFLAVAARHPERDLLEPAIAAVSRLKALSAESR